MPIRLIALTGGIGSGKTTAAHMFAALGVQVLYADQITRELTQPNTPAYSAIVNHFGTNVLSDTINAPPTINRRKLREIIFQDPQQRQWLENLLHPLVAEYVNQQLTQLAKLSDHKTYCILEVPLLIESSSIIKPDRTLLVDCSEELQISRATARDKASADQIIAIIKTQLSRETRIAHSDDIIYNNGSLQQLQDQVDAMHAKYSLHM